MILKIRKKISCQCLHYQFSSVQSLSHVRLFATPWIAAHQASLSITNSRSSLTLTSIESVTPSSHLILCRPLFLLPPIPSSIRGFSNESSLHMRWPKYWSFSFSIIPSKEHPGLISFRMDWLDLLAVPGTLKSLLQYHSSKASILLCSAFFSQLHSSHTLVMEKAMAPHSSTLAWKIPWIEEPGRLQSMGSLRVRHDWATSLSFSLSCTGEENGNPLQCSCLEDPRDGETWWAAIYGVAQSWTRLKWLSNSTR